MMTSLLAVLFLISIPKLVFLYFQWEDRLERTYAECEVLRRENRILQEKLGAVYQAAFSVELKRGE